MLKLDTLHPDCRHFIGSIPCQPHKLYGVHCQDCHYYDSAQQRILIIKLAAIGDVIRSSAILHRLKKDFPHADLYWLTLTPIVIPPIVDHILKFTLESVIALQQIEFDLLINLDKDTEACALTMTIPAKSKKGFILKHGRPWPADDNAVDKFLTGLFDDFSKANKKSYLQELFEICGYEFKGEKYILDNFEGLYKWPLNARRPVVGLNTGCGGRWKSRLWPEKNWTELSKALLKKGYDVVLLGGQEEHEKNKRISQQCAATYLGHFPLQQFINLVNQCDLVVTAVTMAMHIAIGLGKKIVLFNNTFNRHEFELYGLGEILEPEFDCDCYYASECPNDCMQYIYVDRVLKTCEGLLHNLNGN